jgi:tetratricopeptide (TPR) repeat protein
MSAKKPAAPTLDRRSLQALELFEKGMKALGKRDYERARDHFESLTTSFPEERDLLERARAYLALCARHVEKRPAFRPKTFEEMLHHGVYLHNRGEYEEALKFLRQAADIHPRNEHVLYCLAATLARAGDAPGALKALRSAVTASPGNRTQARTDTDFDALREDEEFISIVYPQAS